MAIKLEAKTGAALITYNGKSFMSPYTFIVDGDDVSITLSNGPYTKISGKYSEFTDSTDTPFASVADLVDFLSANRGFNTTPGGSGVIESGLLIEDENAEGTIDPSAALDLQTTGKGVLLPRMTTAQRNAIPSPANYLTIVNTDTHRYEMYHPTFGWTVIGYIEPLEVAGTVISFTDLTIYNSVASPATGNITNDLTGAKKGIIQKIYHQRTSAPTFPAGWVLRGGGIYVPSTLNIIYATFCGGTRVEYWIA